MNNESYTKSTTLPAITNSFTCSKRRELMNLFKYCRRLGSIDPSSMFMKFLISSSKYYKFVLISFNSISITSWKLLIKWSSINRISPYFLIDSIICTSYFSTFKARRYANTKDSWHSYLHKNRIMEVNYMDLLWFLSMISFLMFYLMGLLAV